MKSLKSLFFALALFTAVTIQAAEKNLVQLEKNFKTPTKEYLPLPLWHLNGQLSTEIIQDQMTKAVLESGFGGFCLLPVRSTKPAYLSEEYFDRYSDMLETAKKLDMRIVFYDDIDATVDDICSDAADALRDVFKTAHSVGRFVRQQLTPKKKKNVSAQNSPMTDEKVEQGVVHIDSDSSEEEPGVQPQSMIIDVEDGNDGTDTVE